MSREVFDEIKRQIPLLAYLKAQQWQPIRQLDRSRWMGVCPLPSGSPAKLPRRLR